MATKEERIERLEEKIELLDALMMDIETAKESAVDPDTDKTFHGLSRVVTLLDEAYALVEDKYGEIDEQLSELHS